MPDPTAGQIVKRSDTAFSVDERANAEILWREIAAFMLPNASDFITSGSYGQGGTGGLKTTERIFDGTAILANRDLASAIDSTLTNPATQWASTEFESAELNRESGPDGAAAWLQKSTEKMFEAFNQSNFNIEKTAGYKMLTSMGQMILLQESSHFNEDGRFTGFQFKNIPVNELAWSENSSGFVDTVYRRLQITAKQAFERFGDKVSDRIKTDVERNPDVRHDFIHAVFPRNKEDIDTQSIIVAGANRPFVSAYIERRSKQFTELSGFYEFPMYVARFEKGPNEGYGRGAGHVAMPDTRTLNALIELVFEAAEMGIFPPIITNAENVPSGVDFSARSVVNVDDIDALRPLHLQTQVNLAQLNIERLESQINRAFFLDKIQLPPRENTGEMSAFEVAKRLEEMNKAFGPTLSILEKEYLQPLILRSFNSMLRGGAFDPIPPSVKEEMARGAGQFKIIYLNTLARAQKFEQIANIRQYVASAQELAVATGSPEPLDRIDTDEIMKINEEVLGIPKQIILSDKAIAQIRESRAQQQEQQQSIDNTLKAADAASKIA